MEKKSKIEKLVFAGDLIENELERIRIKINKIIDYLNSQDQEESEPEKVYVDPIVPDFIAEKLAEERYNTREILLNGTKPLEVEDTPEQKEEWEEELGKLMSTWGKVLFVNKGRIGAGMQTAMYLKFYHFIKDLLSEREREVLNSMREWVVEYHKDNWDIRDFDAEIAIGKIIDRELSKLNNK